MIIYDNGAPREMTEEELNDYLLWQNDTAEEDEVQTATQADRIEAQVMYTALMTDTLLED